MTSTEERAVAEQPAPKPSRGRRIAVIVLLTLSVVTGLVGNLSGWAWWFLFDTQNFVKVVAPLSDDPDVSEALARELVDQIFTAVDVQQRIEDALPDRASFVAGPITAGAQQFATDGVQRVLESDQFQEIWRDALTRAHQVALRILRDEGNVLDVTNGVVTLDISSVATVVDERLTERGFDLFDPEDLPESVGQITLLENDQLASAQRAVEIFDAVQLWAPLLTLGFFGAAIAVSVNRRRTIVSIGLIVSAVMLVELVVLRVVRRVLLDNVKNPDNLAAVESVWDELTHRLRQQDWALLVLGLAIAGAAYLAGPSRRAVAIRGGVQRRIGQLREGHVSEGTQDRLERVIGPHRRWIEVLVFVLAFAYLMAVSEVTPLLVLAVALVVVVLLGCIELAAGPRRRT